MLRLYQARRSLNGRQGFAAGVPGSRDVDRKFTQQRQYLEQLVGRCSRAFPPANIQDGANVSEPKWRNWQTRMVQVHVPARVWGFESLLRHQVFMLSTIFGA